MAAAGIVWEVPPSVLAKNTADYARRLYAAVVKLGQYFAAKMESFAKAGAVWQDRTGHARQGLFGVCIPTAAAVTIFVGHTVSYGIWLEVANQGRFAILLRTIDAHIGEIMSALSGLTGG